MLLGIILACVLCLGGWTAHISIQSCQRVDRLERIAQQQAYRSLKTLPTLAYYKAHPDELSKARDQINGEIAAFAPESCSLF